MALNWSYFCIMAHSRPQIQWPLPYNNHVSLNSEELISLNSVSKKLYIINFIQIFTWPAYVIIE